MASGSDPQQRLGGLAAARAEYANLRTALDHGLSPGQPTSALIRALDEYLDQVQQNQPRRQLLNATIGAYPAPASDSQRRELALLHNLAGLTALAQHRLDVAGTHHQTELQLVQALGDRHSAARAYHQLGRGRAGAAAVRRGRGRLPAGPGHLPGI